MSRFMRRYRVLQIVTRLNIGGPALQIGLLASIDPSQFETLVVSGREESYEGSMATLGRLGADVSPLVIPSLARNIAPVRDVDAFAKLTAVARWFRPDLVNTHLSKAGSLGRLAALAGGTRVVVHTYHGSVWQGYFGRRETRFYLGVERALAHLTTRLVAITETQRDELIRLRVAPATKISVVPLGLALEEFEQPADPFQARRKLGLDPAAKCVALVARLVPIKDIPTFLRSVAELGERFPNLQALVVGDGPERPALEQLAGELGISSRCRFTGWIGDVRTVYAAADVVALSSINEGASASLVEAMAAGRPVVATAVGGVPEVVTERGGLLVPPRNPHALATAIGVLLSDEGRRRQLGATAREFAIRNHSGQRLIRDYERMYLEMLGEAHIGSSYRGI